MYSKKFYCLLKNISSTYTVGIQRKLLRVTVIFRSQGLIYNLEQLPDTLILSKILVKFYKVRVLLGIVTGNYYLDGFL